MTDYDYNDIAKKRAERPSCRLTSKRRAIIEADLVKFINNVSLVINVDVQLHKEADCNNVCELRQAILVDRVFKAPYMENRYINNVTYSFYRAYHDILHHALGGLSFSFADEATAFELTEKFLRYIGADEITIAFARDDILYRNAMYHAYDGRVPAKEAFKICFYPLLSDN